MQEKKPFKILSIDGGGIKGLYSAVILASFEKKHGKINQYFDLICGTSTGGIIALALAAGVPAQKIVDLYAEQGSQIFPYHKSWSRFFHLVKQALVKSKYDDANLKKCLKDVLGDLKISDCETMVLIPTANITTGSPCIIKPDDHNPEFHRDNNHKLVDVALATAAAPTYFPVQTIQTMPNPDAQFVDGGLFANNPSLYGIQEAYRYFIQKEDYDYTTFSLLSVATLHHNLSFKEKLKIKRRSFVLWNSKLISLMIDLQSISTHYHIKYLNESLKGHYVRIESEELNDKEQKLIDLDLASTESIKLLIKKGNEASTKWIHDTDVEHFFKEKRYTYNYSRGEASGAM
ncbi:MULTISPECIES: CBASS cGAMP-activated phospholipase [Bacillus cereus group]|uniref:CBASS cGAMP-activated phospholipase n=1 Tax=Bacillus cereus group TaxID=86661 RepID=UPI000A38F7F4|nr:MULTISPECIES: CBASS cGAMP-activated phospholipase [Bacillus cereus group]OUA84526.1 hypothetical protein BK706_25695 [Bacillus thuringiensis serovar leesis]PDZ24592.1 patatin [Bacillus cereus]PFA67612.1 patatin [Bacillus cereus]